jgi:hypothetical protein
MGRAGSRPYAAENSARDMDGCLAKKSSNRAAPVITTRSGAQPCSSIASRRWMSFQTMTRSGCTAHQSLIRQGCPS